MIRFFLLLTIIYPIIASAQTNPRVIGGVDAGENEFPSVVAIHFTLFEGDRPAEIFCGGTLIDKEWVLTAAHCVSYIPVFLGEKDPPPSYHPSWIRVSLGSNSIRSSSRRSIKVIDIKLFTKGYAFEHDIALLRLATKVDNITPSKWLNTNSLPSSGTVVGWGLINKDTSIASILPDKLQKADLNIYSDSDCLEKLGNLFLEDRSVCAGVLPSPQKDSCYGDSGGPLFSSSGDIIGIVSGGFECGSDKYPGFYTRVSYYDSFIQTTLDPDKRARRDIEVILASIPKALRSKAGESSDLSGFKYNERENAYNAIFSYVQSLVVTFKKDRSKLLGSLKRGKISDLKSNLKLLRKNFDTDGVSASARRKAIISMTKYFKSLLRK